MPASVSTWSRVHVLAAMFFGTAGGLALAACFNPPSAAVMFSCEADDASVCPVGYTCESDGCCHRDGSDVEANLGTCRLGGPGGASTSSTGTTEPTGGATSTGDATTSTSTGDTSTSTGDTSTGTTGDTSTGSTGSTGDTGGSSDASSTG
jgi:hypothetical protein